MKAILKSARGMAVVTVAVVLFAAVFAIPVPAYAAEAPQTYTKPGTIWSEIDGGYTALDEREQLWVFYADSDSFIVGQEVELVMSDAGTSDYIYDDEVVDVNSLESPYDNVTVGLFGRYILSGTVSGVYLENDSVWITDQYGEDWFFYGFCSLKCGENVTLIINANGTPNDFSDDFVEDLLFNCCSEED